MLLNSLKLLIDIAISLLPTKVENYIFTKIRSNRLESKKYSDSELQVNLSLYNTNFQIQLLNNQNQIKSYKDNDGQIYEETMVYCLNSVLDSNIIEKNDIIFFDLGAYVGYYASFVTKKLNDLNKVYAIESNEIYYNNILKTIKLNGYKNLRVFNEVLSDRKEELLTYKEMAVDKLHLKNNINNINTTYHERKEAEEILNKGKIIKSTTLDDFCVSNEVKPNMLKIDVHGAEGKILKGSSKILNNSVKVILLELHPQHELDRYSNGANKNEIVKYLIDCDFDVFLISPFRYNKKNADFKTYKKNGKLKYVQLHIDDYKKILFDRNNADIFVLCLKKNISIKNIGCFLK